MSDTYRPGQLVLDNKEQFAKLLHFVSMRRGWITSVPGADEIVVECLPDSSIPDELREMGYWPKPDGEGERILPAAITEAVITEGSTVPMIMTHAGIVAIRRLVFSL